MLLRPSLSITLILTLAVTLSEAQNPGFNYQAVIRNQAGEVLINTAVNLEFDLFDRNGALSCQHIAGTLQTNEFGIVNTVINPPCLRTLNWAEGGNYMRVRLNGSQLPGNQLLNYVPYAFIADSALHAPQYKAGNGIAISNDRVVQLAPGVDGDGSDDLLITSAFGGDVEGPFDNIKIKNGVITSENIANGAIRQEDLNNMGAVNGQVLTWNGAAWVPLTPGPGADNWGNQTATTAAPLTGNGAAMPLTIAPQSISAQYLADNAVTGTAIANGSVSGADLSDMGALAGQVLKWNGAAWVPSADLGLTTVNVNAPITGNGAGTPLSIAADGITNALLADNAVSSAKIANNTIVSADLADMGATAGQVLKWNGAAWAPAPDIGLTTVSVSAPITGNGAGAPLAIAPNGIGNTLLSDNAVNSAKIANGSVAATDLSDMGATIGQLLKWNGAVWAPANDLGITNILTGSPVAGNGVDVPLTLSSGSITTTFLADNAVTSTKIANGTIASADLGTLGANANGQILKWNGTVWTASDPGTNAVSASLPVTGDGFAVPLSLAPAAVTGAYLAPNAVNSGHILDATIRRNDLNDSISLALWNIVNTNDIFRIGGNIGIGMDTPTYKLDIRSTNGGLNVENNNTAVSDFIAVRGITKGPDFYGIGGEFQGGAKGVRAIVQPTGNKTYYGVESIVNGGAFGNTKYGVYAEATGVGSNYAIFGKAGGGSPNYAGFFEGNVLVTGNFSVNGIKSFRVRHPDNPDKEIWYACLEGPEAAAYVRGTAQLVNGEAFIPFPEHFKLIINPASLTIITTPGSIDTYGLAVVEKTAGGFRVKELKGGTGNFQFDWEAKAVRKGCEHFEVVRDVEPNPSNDENR
jgi:hypothetical protein